MPREGPLPQTRYVLTKALEAKLPPILVINKIDRPDARAQEVLNEVYDLFIDLDATEDQLDFPVLYTNAKKGTASLALDIPARTCGRSSRPSSNRYPRATGRRRMARCRSWSPISTTPTTSAALASPASSTARCKTGEEVNISKRDGSLQKTKITKLFSFAGLKRTDITETVVGDIVAIAGVTGITIGETITDLENPKPLPLITIDEPTIAMQFIGEQLADGRARRSVRHLAATSASASTRSCLPTSPSASKRPVSPDSFKVLGRGELQLAILIEMMRREGYELMVGRPEIVTRTSMAR